MRRMLRKWRWPRRSSRSRPSGWFPFGDRRRRAAAIGAAALLVVLLGGVVLLRAPEGLAAVLGLGHGSTVPISPKTPHPLLPAPRGGPLLCAPRQKLHYEWGRRFAVAADARGRFTFYGTPDERTGRPTDHSYPMLSDCSRSTLFAYPNSFSLSVREADNGGQGHTELFTAEDATSAETRKLYDGALETSLRFPDGSLVVQDLRLITPGGATPSATLDVSYLVLNPTPRPKTMALRSLLTPAGGALRDGRFDLAPSPARGPQSGAVEVRTERSLTATGADGAIPAFYVPRPAADSDSTGYWAPEAPSAPDEVVFADLPRFTGSFGVDAVPKRALSKRPSFAVYWRERPLAPGASLAFSHRYGTPQGAGGTGSD